MVKHKKMTEQKSQKPISHSSILQIIAYTSKLLFPKYPSHYFPIFSFIELLKKQKLELQPSDIKFKLKSIPNKLYDILIKNELIKSEFFIFVRQNTFDMFVRNKEINWVNLSHKTVSSSNHQNGLISSYFNKQLQSQLVQIKSWKNSQLNCIFVKENFYYNFLDKHKIDDENLFYCQLQEIQDHQNLPMIAKKCSISITNTPYEIHAELSETILTKYFENARLLYRNHIYEIILDEELLGSFYYSKFFHIFSHLKKIYFKCTNLETKDSDFEFSAIVVKNFTELIQVQGVHAFLPKQNLHDICFMEQFPTGLRKYFIELKSCFLPYIQHQTSPSSSTSSNTNNFNDFTSRNIFPIFLLSGERGSGKFTLLNAIAQSLGMYVYHADCTDIISTIASQTESKLTNVLSRPNLCVPLIICLQNFEVFGVEHNGHEDLRLISSFQTEIIELFTKTYLHPVILVAITNSKIIQPIIQRLFLETINILPPNKTERFEIIKWCAVKENLLEEIYNGDLENIPLNELKLTNHNLKNHQKNDKLFELIAEKTQGFLYGDLKLLFDNSMKEMKFDDCDLLTFQYFEKNLVTMQLAFADSLGAPKVPKVLWSDIGGLAKLKDEIQSSIGLPLKHIHLMGKNMRRSGILLYGPPGTGKTLVAKAVATECNLNFLSVQGPELLNMYVGQSEQNVREVFSRARSASPCVIFLDELDSLAPNRGKSGDSGGVMDRVVSQLLAEMDGMITDNDPQKQIFILAATNRPDLIDSALLRPGRFDKLLYVGPCTTEEDKIAVLIAITQKFILDDKLTLKEVAELLQDEMTGADLYSICSNAWLSAVRRTVIEYKNDIVKPFKSLHDTVTVNLDDFKSAAKKFIPSINQKDLDYFKKLRNNFSP